MTRQGGKVGVCLWLGMVLVLCYGCMREPSAQELANRINSDSPTYDVDREALIKFGHEAIEPCLNRALTESGNLAKATLTELMIGEILKEIDPAAAMEEIENRFEGADLKTRKQLASVAGEIGAPHTKQFILRHLNSLALENVAIATFLLEPYKNDQEMAGVLERALASTSWQVRFAAACVLIENSEEAVPVMEEVIANEGLPLNLRLQTVFLLEMGPRAASKAALRRLRSVRDPQVRDLVEQALERPSYRSGSR